MPALDPTAAYQVFKARDARFDGRLFVGVTSTGVYCRPVCRVRTPKRENCRFFDTPAQAEAASFRPCMKCRPEIAPGPGPAWSTMDASRTLARQAADWLDSRLGDEESPPIAELAERLGVSDRHLRRIFAAEHGVTPLQYLQTRRLLLAKQLLTDTRLPVSQVALASGFRSLRRFNAAFADNYRMSPTRLRKAGTEEDAVSAQPLESVSLWLGYRLPYDTSALLAFITQRAIPGVEAVEGLCIRRSVRPGVLGLTGSDRGATPPNGSAGWLEVEFPPEPPPHSARVALRFSATLAPHSARLVALVRRWLDLDASPQAIDETLADLPGAPGLRLPGSVDAFELVVRAVLGQQVTVAAARTLARRLVERFGEPITTPWTDIDRLFPSPDKLAGVDTAQIAELGIIRSRAGAIVALAQRWPQLQAHLQAHLAGTPQPEALIAALRDIPGIGPWTAHYVAMRALGWPDAFPPQDIAVLSAMKPLFGELPAREAAAVAERWRPWRAYAVLRLWNTLT